METKLLKIEVIGADDCLWRCRLADRRRAVNVAPPVFEMNGRRRVARLVGVAAVGPASRLAHGVFEQMWRGRFADAPDLELEMLFRVAPDNPVIRFQYRLASSAGACLTKRYGSDALEHFRLSLAEFGECREVHLSEFDESVHSFRLVERDVPDRAFANRLSLLGSIVVAEGAGLTLLAAYEHGAQVPDAFLRYDLAPNREMTLRAVKGNYCHGQPVSRQRPFATVWLQLAFAPGTGEDMAQAYRNFVLRYLSPNTASRTPYIFYNTWCYQERNKWWNGRTYLSSMNQERIQAEIDVARRMGIDVFVLDTGWYEKTGDWRENRRSFPDGIRALRDRLDRCGMKLGLWFSPLHAAVTSRAYRDHRDCVMSWDGKAHGPYGVWETEESYSMCLVSRYWEAFADELIRLARELGVTYFKWDAIGQYGCNSPDHEHGTAASTPQERADCYAFEQVRYMGKIIDRLCRVCPDAIVDFDITEGGRAVGLAFLASGKYFLINNGPYFPNLDHPYDWRTATHWSNVYVYPGMARARVCRAPLDFDKWIPSVLFLTHYLPDDPASSQFINLASLVLGQNGIWGDLLKVSAEGVALHGRVLGAYKQVRDDITAASPVRAGMVGGSPEIHEKINPASGRGVVAAFASAAGTYTYVTARHVARRHWAATEGLSVKRTRDGRARLEMKFAAPGAHLVFFGVTAPGRAQDRVPEQCGRRMQSPA